MRIGTGLGSRTRAYAAQLDTTFRQLESAVADDGISVIPAPGFVVNLASKKARTLDSAYAQGIQIENLSSTESVYIGGVEFSGLVATANPVGGVAYNLTAFVIPPGRTESINCRDGSGIYIAASASITVRILGN